MAMQDIETTKFSRRLGATLSPRLLLSELLLKKWFEPVIPFTLLIGLVVVLGVVSPNYASLGNAQSLARLYAEFGFVVLAMGFSLISGGIDLSVGAIFALCNFAALYFFVIMEWPIYGVIAATIAVGAFVGAINGFLIGYMKTRPFLTTLVMLIILRAIVNLLNQRYAVDFATNYVINDTWDFIGLGSVLGIPINAAALLVALVLGHIFLSRSRYGWHLTAIGASRKAARHAGIRVQRMLFGVYVLSGVLCAISGVFYAARQASTDSFTGTGWEFQALTAVVLGGISLAGGRGTVWRAMIGGLIIFLVNNGLIRMGFPGFVTSASVGIILLVAVGIDAKWTKNAGKAAQKLYVNPTKIPLSPSPSIAPGVESPFAQNDKILGSQIIGLDNVEGPEDVILDRQGRIYGSTREGSIIRFSGENFDQREVFAHIGGRPLGMQFDRDENLICCVAGMGVYGVKPDGTVFKVTDETNRTWYKLKDDSRLRMADDLDIAPDGKIYFSDCTTRYDMATNLLDVLEGRPNGRLIVYDPKTGKSRTAVNNLYFPNGVCVSHDGKSVLVASTSLCRVYRYWIEGPKKGTLETLIDNLPGLCDNINRASDGTYWLALIGIRSPAFDLAAAMPDFRLRMIKEIPVDEWLVPGLNQGCVLKFTDTGEVLDSYWDPEGINHPSITSMREHKGYLYLGGLENNRIGRIKLDGADPDWTGYDAYWGAKTRTEV